MDAETWIWTLILFGGTIVIVAFLMFWAIKKDREKIRQGTHDEEG
ncbi:MAG TPA: hypothetical protein VK895_08750 [Jiangellaceae bacterium]|jgi:hypothetical protein|nr:hypothetical protein [Jiangellaceae bacterium]